MLELQVEGMSCSHCANAVTKAVQSVDGAAKVEVDVAGKKVTVDSQADPSAIKFAVIEAGYPVTGITGG